MNSESNPIPKSRQSNSAFANWLALLRVSALPTAISNILAAFLIANQTWQPFSILLLLILSSSCLYLSGMVLNDCFDVDRDRQLRPNRPIPSGKISGRAAFSAYLVLTLAGLLAASFASTLSLLIAAILVAAIYLYNGLIKTTFLAPVAMGLCRGLNVLLGASCTCNVADSDSFNVFNFRFPVWWIAASLGHLHHGTNLVRPP